MYAAVGRHPSQTVRSIFRVTVKMSVRSPLEPSLDRVEGNFETSFVDICRIQQIFIQRIVDPQPSRSDSRVTVYWSVCWTILLPKVDRVDGNYEATRGAFELFNG